MVYGIEDVQSIIMDAKSIRYVNFTVAMPAPAPAKLHCIPYPLWFAVWLYLLSFAMDYVSCCSRTFLVRPSELAFQS